MGVSTRKYVTALPLAYRDPLALHYFEEKSYEEVAEILNMPIGTVGTRINRAKKMIKEKFIKDKSREKGDKATSSWKTLI
jgi:RNA polymerase sigma-70 factor (ECF subfamily)